MNNLERVAVLDDGETFGGPDVVVEYNTEKMNEDAVRAWQESSDVSQLVDYVQDQKALNNKVGRILSINRLIDLYNAVSNCPDDLMLTPEIWEAVNGVDVT